MAKKPPNAGPQHPRDRGPALGEDTLLPLAKRVTDATGCPVVGGVAVILHGGGRSTSDIDIYSPDRWATHEALEAAGILWDSANREHVIDGVAVHMVDDESLARTPAKTSTIKGVRVLRLADLVAAKLKVGLTSMRRSKDITHVLDLIERIPLKKDFAAELPRSLQSPFKALVDQVHAPRRTTIPPREFWKKYA
ncbi:MAG: hypothetical protein R3B68_04690 [Phycisphaerales bacterium]